MLDRLTGIIAGLALLNVHRADLRVDGARPLGGGFFVGNALVGSKVGLGVSGFIALAAFADSLDHAAACLDSCMVAALHFRCSARDRIAPSRLISLSFASHLGCIFAGIRSSSALPPEPCSIGLAPLWAWLIASPHGWWTSRADAADPDRRPHSAAGIRCPR